MENTISVQEHNALKELVYKLQIQIQTFLANIKTVTADYDVRQDDVTILVDATDDDVVVTLPAASALAGRVVNVKKIDSSSHTVTIAASGSDTIDGGADIDIPNQYEALQFHGDGVSAWSVL